MVHAKPKSILENYMNNVLWDFEIKTDHVIVVTVDRRPDREIVNPSKKKKKKEKIICQIVDVSLLVNYRVKSKKTKRETTP